MRRQMLLAVVICHCGCAATPPIRADESYDFSAHGRRVVVMPVELELSEMQIGSVREWRPDWVAAARPLLQEALSEELVARHGDMVTDPEATADYVLWVSVRDSFASAGLVAAGVALVVVLLPVVILFGGSGMQSGGDPSQQYAHARLEEFSSHRVVWQVDYTSGIGDVRNAQGAKETSALLLKQFPWKRDGVR